MDQIFGEGGFVEEMVVPLSSSVVSDSKTLACLVGLCVPGPHTVPGRVAALNSQFSDAWMRLSLRSVGL